MKTIYSDDSPGGWLPWPWLAPFLAIFLVAIGGTPFDLWLEALGFVDAHGRPLSALGFCVLLLVPFAGMGGVVCLWLRFVERRSLPSAGLDGHRRFASVAGGAGVGIAMMGIVVAAIALAGGYRIVDLGPAFATPSSLGWIATLLLCFAFQASVEEFIFRGWLLSTLVRRSNLPVGIAATSAAFTFLHLSPDQPLLLAVISFLFSTFACLLAWRSNSIWVAMGWHTGWNWFGGTGFDVPITGFHSHVPALVAKLQPAGSVYLTGGQEGPEGSLFTLAILLAGSVVAFARAKPVVVRKYAAE